MDEKLARKTYQSFLEDAQFVQAFKKVDDRKYLVRQEGSRELEKFFLNMQTKLKVTELSCAVYHLRKLESDFEQALRVYDAFRKAVPAYENLDEFLKTVAYGVEAFRVWPRVANVDYKGLVRDSRSVLGAEGRDLYIAKLVSKIQVANDDATAHIIAFINAADDVEYLAGFYRNLKASDALARDARKHCSYSYLAAILDESISKDLRAEMLDEYSSLDDVEKIIASNDKTVF